MREREREREDGKMMERGGKECEIEMGNISYVCVCKGRRGWGKE